MGEELTVAYKVEGVWRECSGPVTRFLTTREVVELSNEGLPVTSHTAASAVSYFAAYLQANANYIPTIAVTNSMGWKKGNKAFVLGDTTYGQDERIVFVPSGEGDVDLAKCLLSEGDFDAWMRLLRALFAYPAVMFAVYASMTPPLLGLLDEPNFIVDYYGRTSLGKTTVCEMAASCWGRPLQRMSRTLIRSWDATQVGTEQYLFAMNSLPTFLDDSQQSKPEIVSRITYMTANGVGRTRGARSGGNRRTVSWKTVLFSTGERALAATSVFGGVRARVISFHGSPFGEDQKDLVDQVKSVLRENYGFAGPKFVQRLMALSDEGRVSIRARILELERELAEVFSGNEVVQRVGRYFATVWCVAELFHEWFAPDLNPRDVILGAAQMARDEVHDVDMADKAFELLAGWVQANREYFLPEADPRVRLENFDSDKPIVHYGVFVPDTKVEIYSYKMEELLKWWGYDVHTCLQAWKVDGRLKVNETKGFTKKSSSLGGRRVYHLLLGQS